MENGSKFNINSYVKVKLTEHGERIVIEQRETLNKQIKSIGGNPLEPLPIKKDEQGYTEFQLWDLMRIFGNCMWLTAELPFETEIIIPTIN